MISQLIKKSFKDVNNSPAITLFLVLFLILLSLFTPYIFLMQSKIYGLLILVCIFLLFAVFFGGWLQLFDEAGKKEKKSLAGIFFEGAGKNIVPSIITIIVYSIAIFLVSYIAKEFSLKVFGDPSFLIKDISTLSGDSNAYLDYINNLSSDKMFIIYGWQITFIVLYSVFNFMFMFLPVTFVKTEAKNIFIKPFTAFLECFKFTFKNFGLSIGLYAIFCLTFMLMGILKTLTSFNPILSVINLFIHIYFVSYVIMIIFNCYEQKNSNPDRSDSIGEDNISDTTGEEV